jgi:agmatinase
MQIDVHMDLRDEVGGVRDGYSSPMRRASEMPWVERIVHVATRGLGSARPRDVEDTLAAGNLIVTAREVRAKGQFGPRYHSCTILRAAAREPIRQLRRRPPII